MCYSLSVYGFENVNEKLGITQFSIPCKSWSCPECGAIKTRTNAAKARKGFEGCTVRFATLTMAGNKNRRTQLLEIKKAWNRLRTTLTRNGHKLKYCWVLEACPTSGRPHLHVLLDRYIYQKSLSRLAMRAGFGSIADIRIVKDNQAFNYVTKYLGKGIGSKTVERTLKEVRGRRISFSRGFVSKESAPQKFFHWRISRLGDNRDAAKENVKFFSALRADNASVITKGNKTSIVFNDIDTTNDKVKDYAELVRAGAFKYADFIGPKGPLWVDRLEKELLTMACTA